MRKAIQALADILAASGAPGAQANAQTDKMNFRDRQALIINNAPELIELSGFEFENRFLEQWKFTTDLRWENISSKPITAFEVVILWYDPFNRPMPGGGRWMNPGNNSVDWTPLMPGQSAADGLIVDSDEQVMTSIVYIAAIRFEDGAVWTADVPSVERAIREKLPVLEDLGVVNPLILAREEG